MTCLGKFCALLLILTTSSAVAAQDQTQAQWQRMFELGLKHRTASDLYTALKSDAHGGQQSPPFAQLPDWSGLCSASGGSSFFDRGPAGVSSKLSPAAAEAVIKGRQPGAGGINDDD